MCRQKHLLLIFSLLVMGLVFSADVVPPEGVLVSDAPVVLEDAVVAGGNAQLLTMQYGAVVGQPVKFKKVVTVDGIGAIELETDIPQESTNITVTKITSSTNETVMQDVFVILEINDTNTTTPLADYNEGIINVTGTAAQEPEDVISSLSSFISSIFLIFTTAEGSETEIDGYVEYAPEEEAILEINDEVSGETTYEVTYEMPPPEKTEQVLGNGIKEVTISAEYNYTNVLAFTEVEERLQEEITVHWVRKAVPDAPVPNATEEDAPPALEEEWVLVEGDNIAYLDTNDNGLIDTVLWLVPHLSSQTYMVVISGAAPAGAPTGVSASITYPTADISVPHGEIFNVAADVSCKLPGGCGDVTVTLDPQPMGAIILDPLGVKVAFVCYYSSCSLSDELRNYLTSAGFDVTAKAYYLWTDAELSPENYDVIVCGGYYGACRYAFDSSSDAVRDAFEDEGVPVVSTGYLNYPSYYMGITSTYGSYDNYEQHINQINTAHDIMTGFSGTVSIATSGVYIGRIHPTYMLDPYTKLFGNQDYSGWMAGYVVDAGDATTGTNPGPLVHLGFRTRDSYWKATDSQKTIIKQAICWAATGSHECKTGKGAIPENSGSPFYTSSPNPLVCPNMQENDLCQVLWDVVPTGDVDSTHTFFAIAESALQPPANSEEFEVTIAPMTLDITSPTTDITVGQNTSFNVDATVGCYDPAGCGDVTVTLDPQVMGAIILPSPYVWQPVETGTLYGPVAWSYIMGYKFNPLSEMAVSELCAYVSGTKTVKLWDETRNELASAQVSASGNWACSQISPVPVQPGQNYYVGVCLQGSGGYYRRSPGLPTVSNDVNIQGTMYLSTTGCALTTTPRGPYTSSMYGMADIGVSTGPPPPPEKSVVPVGAGDPFYTTGNNPVTCPSMGYQDTCDVSWDVVATGILDSEHTFFAFATSYGTQLNSTTFNVTISAAAPGCMDVDGDGYGAQGGPGCTYPGEVDCDDGNSEVNPGATEVCNEIDDDCDGQVDEGLLQTSYLDADADGYGDPGTSIETCGVPSGYVGDNTDCDDSDADVNPGSFDLCGQDGSVTDRDCIAGSQLDCAAFCNDVDADTYAASACPDDWGTGEFKLRPDDNERQDEFGGSVYIYGDWAIAGAPEADKAEGETWGTGAAYILQRTEIGWDDVQKLDAPGIEPADHFGISVAMDGDYAMVGAPWDSQDDTDRSGSVYVYKNIDGTWTYQEKLVGDYYSFFGWDIEISGDYAIIGAFADDEIGDMKGAAYIYKRSGSSWAPVKKLTGSQMGNREKFGIDVSIDGEYAVVATTFCGDCYPQDPPRIYLFSKDEGGEGNWGLVKTMESDSQPPGGSYGGDGYAIGLSVSGDYLAVGAPFYNGPGVYDGAVFVYYQDQGGTGNWGLQQKVYPNEAAHGRDVDLFGRNIQLIGDRLAVGAYGHGMEGSVSVFERDGGTWTETHFVYASDKDAHHEPSFGVGYYDSVSFSGSTLLVGALWADDACPSDINCRSGSVYFYDLSREDPLALISPVCPWIVSCEDCDDNNANINPDGFDRCKQDGSVVDGNCNPADDYLLDCAAYCADVDGDGYTTGDCPSSAPAPTATVRATDNTPADYFGSSGTVWVDGDYMIIGAYANNATGEEDGAAYIYYRHQGGDNAWGQVAKLTASDGDLDDRFGSDVALSGDYAFVTAPRDDTHKSNSGAVYVFRKPAGGWADMTSETFKMTSGNTEESQFGNVISVNGDYLVVATLWKDYSTDNQGLVRIYYKDEGGAGQWGEVAKLTASDAKHMGADVAIYGNYVLAGEDKDDDAGNNAGAVYVFKMPAGGWADMTETTKITPTSYIEAGDEFGRIVSIDGDYFVTSAVGDDDKGSYAGAAYVFRLDSGTWVLQDKLVAPDGQPGDVFGPALISGDTIAVSATGADEGGMLSTGAVYLFRNNGASWEYETKLTRDDAQATDSLGAAFLLGDTLAVSAQKAPASYTIYMYKLGSEYSLICPWVIGCEDCDDAIETINPGAEEVCNNVDDDCDGEIDEDTTGTHLFYMDSDEDGYGNPSESLLACFAPEGYVNNSDDCDDTNSYINPAATEVCDGVDNDCNDLVDENDNLPPATSDDAPDNWVNWEVVTVTLTAVDYPIDGMPMGYYTTPVGGECGVAATYYCVDQTDACDPSTPGTTVPVTAEGINYVRYYSVDNHVGNEEEVRSAVVKIDRTMPETGDDASSEWQNKAVTVTLTATDAQPGSGIYNTYWCVDQSGTCNPLEKGTGVPVSAEGVNYVKYMSVDNAGNIEDAKTAIVRIDYTPPTAEMVPLPEFDGDGDVLISWTGADQAHLSGIDYYELYRDDVSYQTTTGTSYQESELKDATRYTYHVKVVDRAGNSYESPSTSVVIDLQPPTVPAMHSLPQYTTVSHVYASWDHSTDPFSEVGLGSGLNHYDLFRDGNWLVQRSPYEYGPSDDGTAYDDTTVLEGMLYTYAASATDNVDHESAVSDPVSTTIDTIPPTTTHSISGIPGDNGWWKVSDITVTLEAFDATSGVKWTDYKVNGYGHVYTGPFLLSNGLYDVVYYSADHAGLKEAPNSFDVKVDTTRPTTWDDAPGGWQATSVTVKLDSKDGPSGVAATYWCVDQENICLPSTQGTNVLVSAEGYNYVRYYTRDMAGNKELEQFAEVWIDYTPPTAPVLTPLPTWDTDGTVELAWTASEDPTYCDAYGTCGSAGFAYYEVQRRDEPAPATGRPVVDYRKVTATQQGTQFFDTALPSNTTYKYRVKACDKVGNCQFSENIVTTTVDTDNPSVQITAPFSNRMFSVNSITVVVDYANTYLVNCQVERTGDAGVYDMAGDNQVSGTATHTFSGITPDGYYDFMAECWDEAGNAQSDAVYDVLVDTTPPVTTDNAPSGCNNGKPITVTLFPNDPQPGSGVAATYYCTDATNTCTPVIKGTVAVVEEEGMNYVRYYSVDEVGNEEAVKSASIYIDTIPPEEQLEVTASDAGECIGQFLYECTEYKTGSVALDDTEEIYASGCLMLENLISDATSGVSYSTIQIFSPTGRLLQDVSSPGPSTVDFAAVEAQLLESESCWVDIVKTGHDNCGNSKTITIRLMLDEDNDGVCNADDLCEDTPADCSPTSCTTPIPTRGELNPNHYEDLNCDGIFEVGLPGGGWTASPLTVADAYGCMCQQILDTCQPGNTEGQYKFGCSTGTLNSVWIPQTGWATQCIGETKPEGIDSDGDGTVDEQDADMDGDGIPNEEDSEPESKPVVEGRQGTGRPDWWCEKNPNKC